MRPHLLNRWKPLLTCWVWTIAAGCNAPPSDTPIKNDPLLAPGQTTLYQQLGGQPAIAAITDHLIDLAIADPRVDFSRTGHPHTWAATPDNLAQLKTTWAQYIGMIADGPQVYEGHNLLDVHTGMDISEGEWLAFMDDLKKTLDGMHVPTSQEEDLMTRLGGTHDAVVNK